MIPIPPALQTLFLESVGQVVPGNLKRAYLKWLRYYWDFCHTYHFPHEHRESLPHFLKKLQEKRQTQAQQEQAAHAIGLYYELLDAKASLPTPGLLQQAQDRLSQEGNMTSAPSQEGKPTPTPSHNAAENLNRAGLARIHACGHEATSMDEAGS